MPIVFTIRTDNYIIMDPFTKETNKEGFNSYTTNKQLIFKNSC